MFTDKEYSDMHKNEIIKRLNMIRAYCSYHWDGNSYDKVRYRFLNQCYDLVYDTIEEIEKLDASVEEKTN